MNVGARSQRVGWKDVATALVVAACLTMSVVGALWLINPARPSAASAAIASGAAEPPKLAGQGGWLRKPAVRESPSTNSEPATPEPVTVTEPRLPDERIVAQRRLVANIVERHRVDADHASSVVAIAYRIAEDVKLDPLLLLAVISAESSFDPLAQNRSGAQGLMQIRTHLHVERFEPFGGKDAAFDLHANIRVGADLLRGHLVREGSIEAALKAYVGAARRPHDSGYGARVLCTRDLLKAVAEGRDALVLRGSPDEFPRAGGAGS